MSPTGTNGPLEAVKLCKINGNYHQRKLLLHLHAWSHSIIEHAVVKVWSVKCLHDPLIFLNTDSPHLHQ